MEQLITLNARLRRIEAATLAFEDHGCAVEATQGVNLSLALQDKIAATDAKTLAGVLVQLTLAAEHTVGVGFDELGPEDRGERLLLAALRNLRKLAG